MNNGLSSSEDQYVKSVLQILRARRAEMIEHYGIDLLGVGGSVARGDYRQGSDIDVAARIVKRIGFFDIIEAKETLEVALEAKVDLVFSDSLPDYRRVVFERDVVFLS